MTALATTRPGAPIAPPLPYRQAKNLDLFAAGAARMQIDEAIALTQQSLQAHGPEHEHWAIAWSGGKDSTATLTLVLWMIDSGMVPAPKRLTILYADTRMEIPPLAIAAEDISACLIARGHQVQRVVAEMDRRFMVYLLGRGVPPPNNGTLRWCTQSIKIDPMEEALREATKDGSILMITGVRQGESAIRDRRIEMSCSKDGAECGQGWYQQALPNARGLRGKIATLAPILHWRVCHIWEWLRTWAPLPEYGDLPTAIIADAYGGDEAEEINARTNCASPSTASAKPNPKSSSQAASPPTPSAWAHCGSSPVSGRSSRSSASKAAAARASTSSTPKKKPASAR